jgi:ABC-2 type transport system ATP-binding protein
VSPVIELRNLTRRFGPSGPPALDSITATIRPSKITGLVGPDGAGKTTLIRLIAGLMRPDEGEVLIGGEKASEASAEVRGSIGYMPQKFGLYEDLSVRENLDLYADLRGLEVSARGQVFAELLAFTDLARFTDRLAGNLSGGMKQKLGLACALLRKPRILLLDEPSVGVDPISRRELWRMVQALVESETTVLWSTAYLDEAERCDEIMLLQNGSLLFEGAPADLTRGVQGRVFLIEPAPEDRLRQAADLVADARVADATIQGSAIRVVMRAGWEEGRAPARSSAAPPRLEDAVIDRLGGGPTSRSPLVEAMGEFPRSDEPVVEARGLTKRFGAFTAARDISFAIRPGEIFGLLGPNGAGKSTTFKMLCGLLAPSEGEGRVAGHDLRRSAADARGRLGYMAQKFSMYGDLSVVQNLRFFAGVYGLSPRAQADRVKAMIDAFELARYRDLNAGDLPLGFQQRLALAAALLHEPPVLFLDEPTSGVDPITRREFWSHINALVQKNVAVLVTTHFMEEAEYCDRIALVYAGRIIAENGPEALKASAATKDNPAPTLEDAFIELVARSQPKAAMR